MKTKTVLLWAISLFVLDQIVKIVINQHFLDVRFDIIPPFFYFRPKQSQSYSYVNHLFNLGMGFWVHAIIRCFITILIVVLYDLLKTISENAKIINIAFIFAFAAILCSLIDTFLWGGSLDFIYLKPLFIFDLKDLYINVFVILFLLYYIKNRKHLSSFKNKVVINHYKNRFRGGNKNDL